MLKKIIGTLTLVICLGTANIIARAQTSAEIGFANLVKKADSVFDSGDRLTAEKHLAQATEILNQNPDIDQTLQAHALKVGGKLAESLDRSLGYFEQAYEKFSESPSNRAEIDLFRAVRYYNEGEYEIAQNYLAEAKAYFLTQRDNENLAQVLNNLGVIAFLQRDAQTAVNLCEQALSINLQIRNLLNADRNRRNIDFFTGRVFFQPDNGISLPSNPKPIIIQTEEGNGGGSPTEISTNGGGTVSTGNGGGGH
jgi:tetratricopeptide (TPR) repeat protein